MARQYDPHAGQAAFMELSGQMRDIAPDHVLPATVRVELVAVTVLQIADDVQRSDVRAKFAHLPGFDITLVDRLHEFAWALWYASNQARDASAPEDAVQVPLELISQSLERKHRMLEVLDYHLGHLPSVAAVIASIREGAGYLEAASDLTRLAHLYTTYQSALVRDITHYDPSDAAGARADVEAILSALAKGQAPKQRQWNDAVARAWTLLVTAYEQIVAGAGWLFRNDPTLDTRFPSLYTVGRSRRSFSGEAAADENANDGRPAAAS